jgi:hypothetical protein
MLYMNVFIVPLFSYIALFFILPKALWERIRGIIHRFFPFNGGAYFADSLVCSNLFFGVKPALKDVWAFNISSCRPLEIFPRLCFQVRGFPPLTLLAICSFRITGTARLLIFGCLATRRMALLFPY